MEQGTRSRRDRSCDLLLRGGCVITVDDDRNVFDPGSVVITADRIEAVGPSGSLDEWIAGRTIDCRNTIVVPGLVDCHTHLFQTLARGLGEGLPLGSWLREFMWPYSFAMEIEDARAAARLGAIEAALAGVTCLVDNHNAPVDPESTLAVADEIEQVGLRGAVGRGIFGPPTEEIGKRGLPDRLFRFSAADELAMTRACIEARGKGSSVAVWPAPVNLSFVEPSLVRGCAELAAEHGTRWHTHCCEARSDAASYARAYGIRPLAWLEREGLLNELATLAHVIWIDDDDLELLGASRPGIAHNPVSNAYLAAGVIRLSEMRQLGLTVALGSDGSACGHRQDLIECMRQTLYAQRQTHLDPTELRCEMALEMATRNGAQIMGIAAGQLAPGMLADVVVVGTGRAHFQPMQRGVAALVYSATASDVEYTIVGGRLVVEGGRCVNVDEQGAADEASLLAHQLLRRAGLERFSISWVKPS